MYDHEYFDLKDWKEEQALEVESLNAPVYKREQIEKDIQVRGLRRMRSENKIAIINRLATDINANTSDLSEKIEYLTIQINILQGKDRVAPYLEKNCSHNKSAAAVEAGAYLSGLTKSLIPAVKFEVGKVYNQYYVSNENLGYKHHHNGDRTFRVLYLKSDGKPAEHKDFENYAMVSYELYTEHRSWHFSRNLRDNPTYHGRVPSADGEYVYEEVRHRAAKNYLCKSVVSTPEQAVKQGLIRKKDLEYTFRDVSKDFIRENPIIGYGDGKCSFEMAVGSKYTGNKTGGVPGNPYLKTVVFRWYSYEQMQKDIRKVVPNAYFM
jgi:hypothetical protein